MDSPELVQIRKDFDEMRGWMREQKLLLRITTACGSILAGIMVIATPAMIQDHQTVSNHSTTLYDIQSKMNQVYYAVFPYQPTKRE